MYLRHSSTSLWKVLAPVFVILLFGCYNMIRLTLEGSSLVWQHYVGIAGFAIIVGLLFINRYYAVVATGLFIALAMINVISISRGVATFFFEIGGLKIPLGQPLAWLILLLFGLLHFESLYNDYLDKKESKN